MVQFGSNLRTPGAGSRDPRGPSRSLDADRILAVAALASAVLAIGACAGAPPPDPLKLPVATVDGQALTVADLNAYLRDNLTGDEGEEPTPPAELDRVKSRLFDNFVDEEVLLAEARRRGVEVTDAELGAYLEADGSGNDGGGKAGDESRRMARRNLTIQKLRDASVVSETRVDAGEVEAYFQRNRDALRTKPRVVYRVFAVDAPAQAASAKQAILKKRSRIDAATRSGEDLGPDYGQAVGAAFESLPDEIRGAIGLIKPGEVSAPVTVDGKTCLLYLVSGPSEFADSEQTLRERARQAVLRGKVEEASDRLLSELKKKARIEIHPENLSFHYVPEGGG